MKPKFIQISCFEGNKIDLRQTKAVLKHKPDLIILEAPTSSLRPITKPMRIPKHVIKKFPWTESENYMWKNIAKLWKNNHKCLVYPVDGPRDLVTGVHYKGSKLQPRKTTNLFWWVKIFLRESFMAKNISNILKNYIDKPNPVILIFLEKFHWQDVKFLLSKPSKQQIWNFYFGRFKKLNKNQMPQILKKENKTLYKYWNNPINTL